MFPLASSGLHNSKKEKSSMAIMMMKEFFLPMDRQGVWVRGCRTSCMIHRVGSGAHMHANERHTCNVT